MRGLMGVAVLAAAEFACVAAIEFAAIGPAEAQFFGGFSDRPRPPPRRGGFFDELFGPSTRSAPQYDQPAYQTQQTDYSRAPAPVRKPDTATAPTTSIVVMGDGMADWLAYGLEEAFADAPEIAIVRRNKLYSGLLRYEQRNDLDWWHVARDILAQEKPSPNYVIMMLGVADRQGIRERDLPKPADKKDADKKKEQTDQAGATQPAQAAPAPEVDELDRIAAPEPQGRSASGVIEFRTDQWANIYSRRIDATVAALKSKGVPVLWVGLPSIRGPKSTADAVYLNDLYRARAERAGAIYIDVWDGFVDEGGRFTTFGPDFEGQRRSLRSGDGVFFTRAGARKLAHYVEREVRRHMSNRGPIALPSGPMGPVPADGKSAVRPLAGPVVPLTVTPENSDVLLGGSGPSATVPDAVATRVLVKGEAVAPAPGRADDFVWPPGSARPAPPASGAPVAATPAPASGASVSAAARPAPIAAPAPAAPTSYTEPPVAAPRPPAPPKAAQGEPAKPKVVQRAADTRPRPPQTVAPQQNAPPRPPQNVRPGPFDWLR